MEKKVPIDPVSLLEQKLLISFPNRLIGLASLTHKSYSNEHRDDASVDNERLEFLGDAVVDLAISHRLMERFPNATEGELSKLRALIVNEAGLARIARAIGLGQILLLGRGEELTGGRDKSSVLADALEAVIGAVYLSGGLEKALELVDRHFAEALDGVATGKSGFDYKTLLQEEAQNRMKLSPKYKVISESGREHEKVFEVEVSVGQEILARASGRSKKDAEQAAAREAFLLLETQEKKH